MNCSISKNYFFVFPEFVFHFAIIRLSSKGKIAESVKVTLVGFFIYFQRFQSLFFLSIKSWKVASQYKPTYSTEQIEKLIQLLQEMLKQTRNKPISTPQPTQTTYIEGFGYVPQGNATTITIGESNGNIHKVVGIMK